MAKSKSKTDGSARPDTRPEMSWIESREEWRKRKKIGGRYRDIYGKTKQEVRDQIKDLEKQEAAGMVLDDHTLFADYSVKWYRHTAAGVGSSAQADYSNALNKHITPVIGLMELRDIRPSHIKDVMTECAHLANRSQSRILGTMRQIMDAAEADGMIYKNPCKGITAKGRKALEKVPLSRNQQEELVAASKDDKLELFVLLCLYAGLRREEALALRWDRVHLGKVPYLEVRAAIVFANQGDAQYSEVLKSDKARRSIPLPDILKNALLTAKREDSESSEFVVRSALTKKWLPEKSFKRNRQTTPDIAIGTKI